MDALLAAGASAQGAKEKPKAKAKGKVKAKKVPEPQPEGDEVSGEEADGSEEPEELSQAAKEQRLRRMCEVKPSGKCHVPTEIHELWKKGGHGRDQLLEILEASNWEKDSGLLSCRGSLLCASGQLHLDGDPLEGAHHPP